MVMMLNDIVTISPPGDKISGTDRSRVLKDGNFAVLGQFANDAGIHAEKFPVGTFPV